MAYDELLFEKAKEQSLQFAPYKENDCARDIELPPASPLKLEDNEGRLVKVRVRNLDGTVKIRNFQPTSKLSHIYKWLIKTEDKLPEFQLVTSYPREVFNSDDTTLQKTGIILNPNAEFDLSQIFVMEEKTVVEKKEDEVEDVSQVGV